MISAARLVSGAGVGLGRVVGLVGVAGPARVVGLVEVAGQARLAAPEGDAGPVRVTGPLGIAEPVKVGDQASPVAPGTADSAAAAGAAVVVDMGSWLVGRPRRWPERCRILNLFVVVAGTSQSCHCSAG